MGEGESDVEGQIGRAFRSNRPDLPLYHNLGSPGSHNHSTWSHRLKHRVHFLYKALPKCRAVSVLIFMLTLFGVMLRLDFIEIVGPIDDIPLAVTPGQHISADKDRMPTMVDKEHRSLLKHLVMVPGHAIIVDDWKTSELSSDDTWYLLDYQREHDVPVTLVDHIMNGVQAAARDPEALLIFSGGMTRAAAGPKSEGYSYFSVAERMQWWGNLQVRARAVVEDFARDSFENVLFSVARFREVTGAYPTSIQIVGYDFKMQRFVDQHRAALRYPSDRFSYISLAPMGPRFDRAGAKIGEEENSRIPFNADPYGCNSPVLLKKRLDRNPYYRLEPYELSAPEMKPLLKWCKKELFTGPLPWAQQESSITTSAVKASGKAG